MKAWKIHKSLTKTNINERQDEIIKTLLSLRELKTKAQINRFFNPINPTRLSGKDVGINTSQLNKTISRLGRAIKTKQPVVVYGDYDADGICATAILWEILHKLGAKTLPFIPHRKKHGYGISQKGIDQILKDHKPSATGHQPLIITVDNGIVAHDAVKYATSKKLEVIITDHHVKSKTLPPAYSFVHTTKLSGSGVSWFLANALAKRLKTKAPKNLELAAIGSVADMVPLLDANREVVARGLDQLHATRRLGLLQLFKQAGVGAESISTYEINFIIAPRLNAMGRLGHALDSLRLICTLSESRAEKLATKLSATNKDRQQLTQDQVAHAHQSLGRSVNKQSILIVSSQKYHEGVIGLIAGRLMERYSRPTIVLSKGKTHSKASARSIPGFNIIQSLREVEDLLVDVGGHPMAAGFTVENKKINALTRKLQKIADKKINAKLLQKSISIDCQVELTDINQKLFESIEKFAPFGVSNRKPIFATRKVEVAEARTVGAENKHLKLSLRQKKRLFPAIGFNLGKKISGLSTGDKVDIAYTIDENTWNGRKNLQLIIKDLK